MLIAGGLRFWNTAPHYLLPKQRELRRLEEDGIVFEETDLIRENVKGLIGAILRRESLEWTWSHNFLQLFPVKKGVKKEFVEEVFQDVCNMLAQALPASLKDGEARYKNMAWYMGGIFSSLRGLARDFKNNMYWSRRDVYEKQFSAAVNQGSGEEYSRWKIAYESGSEYVPRNITVAVASMPEQPVVREKESERRQESAVMTSASARTFDSRSLRGPDTVVPVAVPRSVFVQERPVVISPRRDNDDMERLMDRGREQRMAFDERKAEVLARIEAGDLMHLAADLDQHRSRDLDVIRDGQVQIAARVAIEHMLREGNFGVVERSAPVFFGRDWREDPSIKVVAYDRILLERVAHLRRDTDMKKLPLPLDLLKSKARSFGFAWDALDAEALPLVRARKKKRK